MEVRILRSRGKPLQPCGGRETGKGTGCDNYADWWEVLSSERQFIHGGYFSIAMLANSHSHVQAVLLTSSRRKPSWYART